MIITFCIQIQSRKEPLTVTKPKNPRSISVGSLSPICPPPNLFKDTNGAARPTSKTQSNVEKITAMLVSQNLMGSRPINVPSNKVAPQSQQPSQQTTSSTSTTSSNRVTININQTNGNSSNHRQRDSSGPINGILKNGTSVSTSNGHSSHSSSSTVTTPNGEPRNISFGNM